MTLQAGPGQSDKKAAEDRTAQVAAEKKAQEKQQKAESQPADAAAEQEQHERSLAEAPTAADKVQKSIEHGDTDAVEYAVLADPYPAYEDKSVEELRSEAESRGVEINRDMEKAQLVAQLRKQQNPHNPSWDLMPLEKLRAAAKSEGVELDEEFEKAHLITELHAADTHTG